MDEWTPARMAERAAVLVDIMAAEFDPHSKDPAVVALSCAKALEVIALEEAVAS